MHVIGLTGGIASGKSTVATFFRDRGVPIIDADVLGHRTYEPGTATYRSVIEAFGEDVVAAGGAIDRRVLGEKVFGMPEELARLTAIVWPGIRELAAAELAELESEGRPLVVLEAAVLLEAEWQDLVDEVWVIVVEPDVAVRRLASRNGLNESAARARIESQLSNAERIARADVVIENNATLDDLKVEVGRASDQLHERCPALASTEPGARVAHRRPSGGAR